MQVDAPGLQARESLSATAINLHSGVTEVILFGGSPYFCGGTLADTTVLRFGESTAPQNVALELQDHIHVAHNSLIIMS